MKKYVFDDSTIKTLHSYSKKLFEVFSSADRTLLESDFEWTRNFEVDFSVNPYKYYNFRFGRSQVFIHRFKNGLFSLECYGFSPENLKPFDVNKFNIELYKNLYGRFHSFDEASLAFADVVCDLVRFKTQPLF